ncbi:hypothetical protein EX895_001260 [Sporisorium graminicola]|uniref:Uncharacterized protein n=1 Tax=Sporisorium graminicola TaxID=280036 RepID=A0A4U7L3J0_9BASI|nr:hypothetical protein EX895_001260 [Sporisorium graminicola]TKY89962.1 hypothetical protein EX895_001260 [Sporisorium graminicola]
MASTLSAPPAVASGGAPRPPHQSTPLPQPAGAPPSPSTAPHNAGPHLLSLKVMRASAPSLAVSEKPFYELSGVDETTSSGDELIGAVGRGIEESLTHDLLSNRWEGVNGSTSAANFPISNLLVLPNSFGTLSLGETFRTYLCVRNEAATAVREPSLQVEMQVGASDSQQQAENVKWHQLAHVILPTPTRFSPDPTAADTAEDAGRPVWELAPAQPLETSLGYDIKDLGPHVLVCTVGYKSPLQQNNEIVWVERSFRKYYKFSVDRSPISVRTKVHQPRHASSLTHPDAAVRGRVELEVQVQNVAGNGASLVFQGMMLKPAQGWKWQSIDRPSLNKGEGLEDMWVGRSGNEVLADGDVRQYLFALTPSTAATVAEEAAKAGIDLGTSAEGYAIRGDALGNLDISWRMSSGEPGRLQTSQLVRRRVVSPPVTAPSSSVKLAPQLSAQLTLQASALERLRKVRPGTMVELDVQVAVCDVSGLLLPASTASTNGSGAGDDDDDTPLSEIASSSPRNKRAALQSATDQPLTIRRTLRLALQHCSIEPPTPSTAPLANPASAAAADPSMAGDAPSTPRKTPLPSRTSTPTQASAVSALNKARLQANLSNLVRNSSLSLRPRASVDSPRPADSDSGASRSGTPLPPAPPPKTELAHAAPVDEHEVRKVESYILPEPVIGWETLVELYKVYSETHAQALTRATALPVVVPETFLPSPATVALPLGSTLISLSDAHLYLSALRTPDGSLRRSPPTGQANRAAHTATATLQWSVADDVQLYDAIRFGAVRLVLLSYSDSVNGIEDEPVQCMTTIHQLSVLAETVVLPH